MDRHARQPFAKRCDKPCAIRSIAHRGCRQNFNGCGPHGARYRMVALHDGKRLRHRIGIKLPRIMQPAPKPQHGLFVEYGNRIPPAPFKHHQAHGIGTQIHDPAARCHACSARLRKKLGAVH